MPRKNRDLFDKVTFWPSLVAVVAAAFAAFFTGRQVWIARDIENRQLRAYLFIDHGPLSEVAPGKFRTECKIVV